MPRIKEAKPKAGRRGNNEGSIYQRKSDGRWVGSVTTGYKADGKPIRKFVYGSSRQEVARRVTDLSMQVYKIGYTTTTVRTVNNFHDVLKEWYDLYIALNIECVTDEKYRSMLKKHIFPAFGAFDVKDIDTKRLQRFFNEKIKEKVKDRIGYSSDFIGKMKNLLNNFFKYAVKQNYIAVNPMSDVAIRKRQSNESKEKKGQALRPEIRRAVLEWVGENPLLKPIIITFKLTGLRPQELITLSWNDINFDSKVLSVKTALNRVVEFDDDWNVISRGAKVGKTKTPKSVRSVRMPDTVVDVLLEWKQYCKQKGIQSEFVFPNTRTSEMRTYAWLRSLFRRFMERHDLQGNGTMYTLRHTFATILLEQRENPKIVMELMGHTKIKTTLDLYSHVVDDAVFEQTAHTLDNVFASLTQMKDPSYPSKV